MKNNLLPDPEYGNDPSLAKARFNSDTKDLLRSSQPKSLPKSIFWKPFKLRWLILLISISILIDSSTQSGYIPIKISIILLLVFSIFYSGVTAQLKIDNEEHKDIREDYKKRFSEPHLSKLPPKC